LSLAANSQVLLRATANLGLFLPPMMLNMAKSSKSRQERKINVRPAVGALFIGYSEPKLLLWCTLDHRRWADKLNFVSAPQQHHGFAANDPKNGEIKQISPGTKNECTPISEGPIIRYSSKSCYGGIHWIIVVRPTNSILPPRCSNITAIFGWKVQDIRTDW
jgi:hypothetical protein